MVWEYSYKTDVGRVRSHNEDAVQIFEDQNMLLMVVADGMGGHASGDVASKMAIEFIKEQFDNGMVICNTDEASIWCRQVFEQVNANILDYAKFYDAGTMGTTMVIAIVTETFMTVANIGDSRAYLFAFDQLRQITKDHTFVRELVEKGQISERAAKIHPQKNVISKALGASSVLEFDFLTLEHYEADSILLCTDGLTGLVEDREILAILKADVDAETKVRQLIEKANAHGGRDNISIALATFKEGSASK
ncbi:MAG: Stp1/IreP family PP2C-type Ser/Thr phosphatase [Defluviitaleaceae bacterium]|nr:Stp1/IreP family PP2C-type Ser/Thr phosphatase [Defluviitaleaceae bacterium]